MADNKKKEAEGKDGEGKKKGLPAIILVAVGAALGGAGVVFAVPPKEVVKEVEAPVYEVIDVIHPDLLEITFNPSSRSGQRIASFKFQFVYSVREDREKEAFDAIKGRWLDARSNLLSILSRRSVEELRSESGIAMLEKAMIDDLDRTLFPEMAGDKVAKVARVLWDKQLIQ